MSLVRAARQQQAGCKARARTALVAARRYVGAARSYPYNLQILSTSDRVKAAAALASYFSFIWLHRRFTAHSTF
ncbi:MAG TPA: hypothetical protein V6D34_16985 [Candidatus Sericytochromatia bacterium]